MDFIIRVLGSNGGVQFFDSLITTTWPNPNPGVTLLVDSSNDTLVGYTSDGVSWTDLYAKTPVVISTTAGENPISGNAQWPDPPEGAVFINRVDGAGWAASWTAGVLTWEPLPGGKGTTIYVGPAQGLPATGNPNAVGNMWANGNGVKSGTYMVTPKSVYQWFDDANDFVQTMTGVDFRTVDVTDATVMHPLGYETLPSIARPVRYMGHAISFNDIASGGATTRGDWFLFSVGATMASNQPTLGVAVWPGFGNANDPSTYVTWNSWTTAGSAPAQIPYDPNTNVIPAWVKIFDFNRDHAAITTTGTAGLVPTDVVAATAAQGTVAVEGDIFINTMDHTMWVYGPDPVGTGLTWVEVDVQEHTFLGPKDLPGGDPNTVPALQTGFTQGNHLITDKAVWFWNLNPVTAAFYGEPNAVQPGPTIRLADGPGVVFNFTTLDAQRKSQYAVGDLFVTQDTNRAYVFDGAAWVGGGIYPPGGSWVKEYDLQTGGVTVTIAGTPGDNPGMNPPAQSPRIGDWYINSSDGSNWVWAVGGGGVVPPNAGWQPATPGTGNVYVTDTGQQVPTLTTTNPADDLGGTNAAVALLPNFAALTAAAAAGLAAVPTTAWTGEQHVVLTDGTVAHWNGVAWRRGTPSGETIYQFPATTTLTEGDRFVNRTDHTDWVYAPDPTAPGNLIWIPLPADNTATVVTTSNVVPSNPITGQTAYNFTLPPKPGDMFVNRPDARTWVLVPDPTGPGNIWEIISGTQVFVSSTIGETPTSPVWTLLPTVQVRTIRVEESGSNQIGYWADAGEQGTAPPVLIETAPRVINQPGKFRVWWDDPAGAPFTTDMLGNAVNGAGGRLVSFADYEFDAPNTGFTVNAQRTTVSTPLTLFGTATNRTGSFYFGTDGTLSYRTYEKTGALLQSDPFHAVGTPTVSLTKVQFVPDLTILATRLPVAAHKGDEFVNTADNRNWVHDGTTWVERSSPLGGHAFMGPKDLPGGDPNTSATLTMPGYSQGDHIVTDKAVWFWNTDVGIAALYGEPLAKQMGAGGRGSVADTVALNALTTQVDGDVVVTRDDGVAHVWDGAAWQVGGTYVIPAAGGMWVKEFDLGSTGAGPKVTISLVAGETPL